MAGYGRWCFVYDSDSEPGVSVGEGIIAGYRTRDDGSTVVVVCYPLRVANTGEHPLHEVMPRADCFPPWTQDGDTVEAVVQATTEHRAKDTV